MGLVLVLGPFHVWALDAQRRPEQGAGRELLAQQVRIDRPDLKMEGEVVLRTVSPLTGELRLQKARGEPRQIFAGVMRLLPGARNVLDDIFDQVNIHDLSLEELLITVTREGYTLNLARATIPEGGLEQVTGWLDLQKNWRIESGSLRLTNLPLRVDKAMPPMPVSYRKLQATGERRELFAVDVEKIRLGHLAVVADPTGFFGNVLQAMGYAKGLRSAPILFDRLAVTAMVDAQQVVTQSLMLQAPGASLSGKAAMPWQPVPRHVHVEVDVTAGQQPVRHFKTVMPLVNGAAL
ncbi:MAG: hypothetical protein H7838_12335 [Magnetococcus sp. DMHC-8]